MYIAGNVLKIREWDDMAEEFGVDCDGDIKCYPCFLEEMKFLCGKQFTVKRRRAGILYESEEGIEGEYAISKDMLEPIYGASSEFDIASEDELNNFLFS